jgi:hypothetical protein
LVEYDWRHCSDLNLMLDSLKDCVSSRKVALFGCACCRRIWDLLIDEHSRTAVATRELHADKLATASELQHAWEGAYAASGILATRHNEERASLERSILRALGIKSQEQSAGPKNATQMPQSALLWMAWTLVVDLQPKERTDWLAKLNTTFETDAVFQERLAQLSTLQLRLESQEDLPLMAALETYYESRSCSFASSAVSRLAWAPETPEDTIDLMKAVSKYVADAASVPSRSMLTKSERIAQCSLLREVVGEPFQSSMMDRSQANWHDDMLFRTAQAIYENREFKALPHLADLLEVAGCHSKDILDHCRSNDPHVRGCWVIDLILGKQ